MIDGWEELIIGGEGSNRDMLSVYAAGRGAGLFAALAPTLGGQSASAGKVWALWDLAGHLSDPALAEDPVLKLVDPARRGTLIATRDEAGVWRLPLYLGGPHETVFFDC